MDAIYGNGDDIGAGGNIITGPAGTILAPGQTYTGNYQMTSANANFVFIIIDWGDLFAECEENNNRVILPLNTNYNWDNCDSTVLNINHNPTLDGTYKATDYITTDAVVYSDFNVVFQADNEIIMGPGFHAREGTDFRAYLETCDPTGDVTSGGIVANTQTLCPGQSSVPFTNAQSASGGDPNLAIEYLWMTSTGSSSYPNGSWNQASGVNNQATYTPPSVTVNTHFVRLARRAGFPTYNVNSNIVSIIIASSPIAQINGVPSNASIGFTVNASATAVSGATYEWDFNGDGVNDAFGQNASFTYNMMGSYVITLAVSYTHLTLPTICSV